jgi:hypothetical protein
LLRRESPCGRIVNCKKHGLRWGAPAPGKRKHAAIRDVLLLLTTSEFPTIPGPLLLPGSQCPSVCKYKRWQIRLQVPQSSPAAIAASRSSTPPKLSDDWLCHSCNLLGGVTPGCESTVIKCAGVARELTECWGNPNHFFQPPTFSHTRTQIYIHTQIHTRVYEEMPPRVNRIDYNLELGQARYHNICRSQIQRVMRRGSQSRAWLGVELRASLVCHGHLLLPLHYLPVGGESRKGDLTYNPQAHPQYEVYTQPAIYTP